MTGEILRLLASCRWFLLMSLGYLLTTIGSGLTQLVVYGELALRKATPVEFSTAFVLSLAASLLALRVGQRALRRFGPFQVLVACEALGLVSIAVPLVALSSSSDVLLAASTLLPGAAVGAGVPAYGLLVKRGFSDAQYAAVAAVESIGLSANVLLGTALGTLLFPFVARTSYLAFDAVTYLGGGVLIAVSGLYAPADLHAVDAHATEPSETASVRVYALVPLVAILTAPALALLPYAGSTLAGGSIFSTPVNAALVLLLARGLSQLVGPAAFDGAFIGNLHRHKQRMAAMAVAFVLLYLGAFASHSLPTAAACVLAAQVLAYALGAGAQAGLFKEHTEAQIVPVSTRTYQVQLIGVSLTGLAAGAAADRAGALGGLAATYALLAGVAVSAWLLIHRPFVRTGKHP